MVMEIQIRDAGIDDYETVHKLLLQFALFQGTPEKCRISLEEMKENAELFQCLLAVKGTEIIGFASWFYGYYSWSGKAIYLDDLYVLQDFRGIGVGSKLFDTLVEKAKAENCKKLRWQVSKWNESARTFYESRGAIVDDVDINCDLYL